MIDFAVAMENPDMPVNIFVGDYLTEAPAKHVYPTTKSIYLPRVDDGADAFANAVLAKAIEHEIDLVIPLSDFELRPLSRYKTKFQEAGIFIVVSDSDVVEKTMNKKNAHYHCIKNDIPTPKSVFRIADFNGDYPCVVKPIEGSGSKGLRFIQDASELSVFRVGLDLIQPLIEGDEFGIDILNDFAGDFVKATTKRKLLMRAGETDRAEVIINPMLGSLAEKIGRSFRHNGNLDVDVIVDKDGQAFCLDFNARFGGGYPATHVSGMNYLACLFDYVRGRESNLPNSPELLTVMKGISIYTNKRS